MSASFGIGGFAQGLGQGLGLGFEKKARDKERLQDEEDLALRKEDLAWRKAQGVGTPFLPSGGGGYSGGGQGLGGSTAPYDLAEDPVAEGLAPEERAFLNMIAGGESAGKYNVRYTPRGGESFEGYAQHPGIMEAGPHGPSSAAGRYQFTKTTWNDLGGGDFSPARQDVQALALARRDYKARTGRDFDADLKNGVDDRMIDALAPTWAALKSNRARHAATFRASLQRYGSAEAAPAAAAPAPVETKAAEKPMAWSTVRRIMAT